MIPNVVIWAPNVPLKEVLSRSRSMYFLYICVWWEQLVPWLQTSLHCSTCKLNVVNCLKRPGLYKVPKEGLIKYIYQTTALPASFLFVLLLNLGRLSSTCRIEYRSLESGVWNQEFSIVSLESSVLISLVTSGHKIIILDAGRIAKISILSKLWQTVIINLFSRRRLRL